MATNFRNRTLFHGDNLDFLRAINSETVHLIATDPPFNKGRDFHATPDSLASGASFQDRWSWERDVHQQWTDKIKDDYPSLMEAIESARYAHSDGMGAFMCFMAVRLMEMHRVLRGDGSLYLHCDPTASHYLKAVMDAIFGYAGFRSEITWRRTNAKGLAFRGFPNNADSILYYSKSDQFVYNRPYRSHDPAYVEKFYRYIESETGRRYTLADLANPNRDRPNLTYEFLGVNRVWRWTKERMQEAYDNGLIVQKKPGSVPRLKRYLDEMKGVPVDTIWDDIGPVQSRSRERVGYPTQKPVALYERIVRASSKTGDIVLDPFCGCATTLIAAERLGRQWVGVDIWDKAHDVVIDRLKQEGLSGPDGDTGGKLFAFGDIAYTKNPPERTDEGNEAVPFLRAREVVREPKDVYSTNAERREFLLKQDGCVCQGCFRPFDDDRYLELDHNRPRSDGGWNHIDNRVLLCGPCNRLKSNRFTLSGLRGENKKQGCMYNGRVDNRGGCHER